jgi:sugar porter (SP) family MFS transporter
MWFFPFSPRWLADKGRIEEARQVLADIHGNGDPNHPRVQLEMEEINATIHFEKNIASHRYTDLFKPGMAYRVFLGVCLQIWQQLTGMNIIMFYAVLLFEQAGVGDTQEATLLSSGISYVVNVVMTVPAILFVDKWGRRPTLIFGALAMSIFLWAVGGILATQEWYIDAADGKWKVHIDSKEKINGVVACIYLFVASFATTWGPLGWVYPAEIYPLRVRAMAVSLSTASNWLFNWILNFVVPLLMQRIHYGLYLLFAAFNFLMCLHVFLFYPETKGYTLEEMDVVFQHNPRKKVPQEVLDQFMADRNETRGSELASSDASEKKVEA